LHPFEPALVCATLIVDRAMTDEFSFPNPVNEKAARTVAAGVPA